MMECKAAQELLSEYLDGELSGEERIRMDEHLRSCSHCTGELTELQAIVSLCRSLPEAEPPAVFREQLYRRLAAEIGHERINLWQSVRAWARQATYRSVTAAFASVLILIFSINGIVALRYDNPLFSLAGYGRQAKQDIDKSAADGNTVADNIPAANTPDVNITYRVMPFDAAGAAGADGLTGSEKTMDLPGKEAEAPRSPVDNGDAMTAGEIREMMTSLEGKGGAAGMLKAASPVLTRGMRMAHRVRLVLAVDDLEASHGRVNEITAANAGFVSNITYRYGNDNQEEGRQVLLQIPETLFTATLAELEGLGRVTGKEMSEVNIAVQAAANESRLSNINRQAETLNGLRVTAADELKIVQIDNELDFIQNEANILTQAIENLNSAQIELVLVPNAE